MQLHASLLRHAGQRELDEHGARAAEREAFLTQVAVRLVEHDLPAEQQLGYRRRTLSQLAEDLEMSRVRRVAQPRRVQVRREHHALDTVGGESLQHANGGLEGSRAVVHTRQQVRVYVDHRTCVFTSWRAAGSRRPTSRCAPSRTQRGAKAPLAARSPLRMHT